MLTIRPIAGTPAEAFRLAADLAPYLSRAARRAPDAVKLLEEEGAEALQARAIADAEAAGELETLEETMSALREAKLFHHISVAARDLSGQSDVSVVTADLTQFANTALAAALKAVLAARGVAADGLFMFALGKMGAFELNYSSDIDVAAFFDPDVFDGGSGEAQMKANRVVQETMRVLEEQTGDGYVFRTDLRLRPDPSSTPPAVSTRMAALYYESVGQNWERMVWIKARPVAGDIAAAERFQDLLTPFVWRRHMDYWAIADVQAVKRMINSKAGAALDDKAPDVKLGPGGIREIEFFAQTQQIVLGGRNEYLRNRKTLASLQALDVAGAVDDPSPKMSGLWRAARRRAPHPDAAG